MDFIGDPAYELKRFVENWVQDINEINARYAKPRIRMTPMVKFSLLLLRIYLVVLVLIMLYKFMTLVK